MAALRKMLMYSSMLIACAIFMGWILTKRTFDILPLGVIFMFLANAFYMYFSKPTVQTSGVFEHFSTTLARISLKLDYISQEAKVREIATEEIRQSNAKRENYKLQVARDMLVHLQQGTTLRRVSTDEHRQFIQQKRMGDEAHEIRRHNLDILKGDAFMQPVRPSTSNLLPPRQADRPLVGTSVD